jgi:predicted nucleic acid-binding protein
MRILFDSNRYKDFCSGEKTIVKHIKSADKIYFPFIVIAELRSGFACGTKAKQNEAVLTQIINKNCVDVLYADEETTHYYAYLFKQLREQGTPIPTNDIWIAAIAIQYDLLLASRDKHFKHLPQIPII